jgi:carbamate kinase
VRIVVALGGNAMTAPDGRATPADQEAAIELAMRGVAEVIAAGHEVVVTHGNGPQVGNLLVKNEIAAAIVPPVPLDWCGAQTQGTIGVLILDALSQALRERQREPRVAALVSRTLVDSADPHFAEPTKPIGRYLPAAEAATMMAHGQRWQDRGERGWRRVVASPEPLECLEAPAVSVLLAAGYTVVCAGGGGVPVVRAADGSLRGVEAVIDKDLTAAQLAQQLDAELLIIATDVPNAVIGWGTPQARPLGAVSVAELRDYAAAGEFSSGSMGPKVDAACRFVEAGGRSIICSLTDIAAATDDIEEADDTDGAIGTVVTR